VIEGISSPGWLSLIDFDAGGNGNFANEPSPQTIMFWLGANPSIVLDKPAARVEFFYSTSVTLIVTAFDEEDGQIAQVVRAANFNGGSGDPNGDYNTWTPLTVQADGKKIKRLTVVGGPNFTGFDDLKICYAPGVDSVELTQAIQQWQSLDDLKADLEDDREAPVPVIAGKPAVFRVYLEEVPNVTQVTVEVSGALTGSKAVSLQPQCTAEKQRRNDGGCASADFYFTPADGDFDITVKVKDTAGTETDSHDLPFTARETDVLKLKAVSMCDAIDAAGNWQCASAADLAGRAGVLRKIAPTRSVTVETTATQVRRDVATFASVDDWWGPAIGDVANLHGIFDSLSDLFGTTVKYYAMIRPALPGGTGGMANDIPGHGAGSRTSAIRLGVETASEVVAHETGHMLGLRHTNTAAPAAAGAPPGCYNLAVDPATDWPFGNNRIQSAARLEVGYDVVARRILDPQNTYDIMSYCVPRWISPQRYKSMIAALDGGAVTSASFTAAAAEAGPSWLMSGVIVGGAVQFDPLFTFETASQPGEGTHRVEVLDGSGAVLASRAFTPFTPDAETTGAPAAGPPRFSVMVPQPAGAASLVVRSATGEAIGTRVLGGAVPAVQFIAPGAPGFLSGVVPVIWTIADPDSATHTTRVHYSADDGLTWSELGVVNTSELRVDFERLPGGTAARIRLIVSDGINSSTSTFGPFTAPRKNTVSAHILSPSTDVVVQPGLLFLEGVGTDVDDGTLTGAALKWSSDVAGELGSGEVLGALLAPGRHVIQLQATDSDGNTTSAHVNVVVAGPAPLVDLTTEALDTLPTTCVAASINVTAAGLPATLVEYSLDGGATWIPVAPGGLPYRFIVPGSGFFHLIARAFDASGQMTADGEQFFTSAECAQQVDLTPPVVTPTLTGTAGNFGWFLSAVTVSWTVQDLESGIVNTVGCDTTALTADTPGETVTCSATNGAGMTTTVPVTIKIDATAPAILGLPESCVIWPPNHKLVTVGTVTAADGLSGVAVGALSVTGTSSEPAGSEPDVVIAQDGAGGIVVQLRAARLGTGAGRTYTLAASATDVAGNTTMQPATCVVPHDQRR
jgi:hypothetical protein